MSEAKERERRRKRARDGEPVDLDVQRRFRGLVAACGCLALFAAWGVFAGVPLAVVAWRFWFGS